MLVVIFQGDSMGNSRKSRSVGVPRGLLKFLVLKMINEKPMSGVEIVEEIEKQTGSWKPSSGSIYPLLSFGFIGITVLILDQIGLVLESITLILFIVIVGLYLCDLILKKIELFFTVKIFFIFLLFFLLYHLIQYRG